MKNLFICKHCGASGGSQVELSVTRLPAIWLQSDGTSSGGNGVKLYSKTRIHCMYCCMCQQAYTVHLTEKDDSEVELPFCQPTPYCQGVY